MATRHAGLGTLQLMHHDAHAAMRDGKLVRGTDSVVKVRRITDVAVQCAGEEPTTVAWRIYAWTVLGLAVITFVGRIWISLKRPSLVTNWDLFEAVFNFVLVFGLFGYVYQRPYLAQGFWEITAPLAWIAFIYSLFSPKHRKLAKEKTIRVAMSVALASFGLSFPGMLAVTLYAYARPEIWR